MTLSKLSDDYIFSEALRVASEAQKKEVPLRLYGACAFRAHCHKRMDLLAKFERHLSDLDFSTYNTVRPDVLGRFFADMGFKARVHYVWHAQQRQMFYNDLGLNVDVFIGDIEFCHVIPIRRVLELDFPSIPLVEMLLEKLQIVKLTEKDVKDLVILLLEHPTGEVDKETINLRRLARILSDDWGFYYTVTTNLNKFKSELLPKFEITEDEKSTVSKRIDECLAAIENEPKSLGWKMRAKVGPRKKWYADVEEVAR